MQQWSYRAIELFMLNPFGIMRISKYLVLTGQQLNPPERTARYGQAMRQ